MHYIKSKIHLLKIKKKKKKTLFPIDNIHTIMNLGRRVRV